MSNLKIHGIPVPAGYKHPDIPCGSGVLPAHEFTMGVIAPKGSGKTTFMANLLEKYKGYFRTILVFSPTIQSDEKWDWYNLKLTLRVKEQSLLAQNVELKKWVRKKIDELAEETGEMFPKPPAAELEGMVDDGDSVVFDPKIPEECFFEDYDDDTFMEIIEEQNSIIKLLKKHGGPKYLANRILIIFDDLVGSPLFAGTRGSYFKGVNTRHRHFSASFMMVSQGYKEVRVGLKIGPQDYQDWLDLSCGV